MSDKNIGKWLSILERLISIIKPKFHNAITKTVVGFGLALVVESQINIFEAFAVAIYESIFGPSDFLRNLFSSNTNPWFGIIFVVLGLIYNAVITVGLELIQKYKESIPKKPELELSILNSDLDEIVPEYRLRGKICIHNIDDIPDNDLYSAHVTERIGRESYSIGSNSNIFYRPPRFDDPTINQDFYRDRAKFLRIWGGSEILRLYINNCGEALATNVRVELVIDKKSGLSASNNNDFNPKLPRKETENSLFSHHFDQHTKPSYDIKNSNTNTQYFFEWSIDTIQAKENCFSRTRIFLRVESEVTVNVNIFCDQFSEPIKKQYKIYPTKYVHEFNIDLLELNSKDFLDEIDTLIMDGYLKRYYHEKFSNFKQNHEELLPD